MLRPFLTSCFVFLSAAFVCSAQSSGSSQQTQTPPPAPAPATPPAGKTADGKDQPAKDARKDTKKPKKVWTEDDVSKIDGGISVVGGSPSSGTGQGLPQSPAATPDNTALGNQIENYRDQIRQLQAQLDATDKKIDDLRNFKADNTSSSGGINPNHGYSMTPIPDQIKQLEEKKKQIQEKMDAVSDEARKKGIEPGQLR